MLRIHHIEREGEPGLVLEGRLVGPWVEECRVLLADAESQGRSPFLDLRGVRFADAGGIALLEELDAGGRIRGRSAFLETLLRSREEPS